MKTKMSMVIGMMAALIIPAVIIVAARSGGTTDVPEGSVFGRETALHYVLTSHPELGELINPSRIRTPWHVENLTPEGWVGSNTVRYTKGEWIVEVSNMVVREPVYSVEIGHTGDVGFQWKGTVDLDGNVVETAFTLTQ